MTQLLNELEGYTVYKSKNFHLKKNIMYGLTALKENPEKFIYSNYNRNSLDLKC